MSASRQACSITFALLLFLLVPTASAAHTGRWTPTYAMHETWPDAIGVHLMLLKGDSNPYHSRVVWLKGRSTAWFGGEWGWLPATDNCTSWPTSSFTNLNLGDPVKNIFCAGHSTLDGPNGGKVLVVGGTETGTERGMRFVKTLTPGAGTTASAWADADSMSEKRWYGTSTTLRTAHQTGAAQALVTTGSKYHHLQMFGGLKGTEIAPSDSLVRRFAVIAGGAWDVDVNPRVNWDGSRPRPRVGHSGADAEPGWGAQIYFGGRRSVGYQRDVWFLYRNHNPLGSEYDYHWVERVPASGLRPDPRFEHSAVIAFHKDMFVFGGRGSELTSGHQVYGDLWRLYWGGSPLAWRWSSITPSGGPGPRFGHTAICHPGGDRMLVFGGVGDTVSNASDNDVWLLTIDPLNHDNATWSKPPLADGPTALKPPARFDHAMSSADHVLWKDPASASDTGRVAIMYGGRSGPAAFADTDLWALWYYEKGPNAGKIRWRKYTTAGLAPSPRAGHTLSQEAGSLVAFLFGGENATGAPDDTVHAVDLLNSPPTWRRFAQKGFALTNHTALDGAPVFARVPEVFREGIAGSDWERLENSPLVQDWYAFNFVVPGAGLDSSRVFTAGPDDTSRYVTVAANGGATPWRRFLSDTAGYVGYHIGSAALYRPGKVMRCGMRDTGAPGTTATATTQFIDVTAAAPKWTASANMSVGRVYHNLVILPTGEVLATGGMGTLGNDQSINPRQRPEIWNPDGGGGLGAWYGGTGSAEEFAMDPVRRGYHNTAILLPDARILCAGGNHHHPGFEDPHLANIFCPPYLFKADGSLATRPVITGAMATTTWNDTFTVCVDAIAPIQSACLIRPGSTTHGFDQNQRFVPLSILAKLSNPERLLVAAPSGSDVAPPGDYLLFVLGSADGANVPSIARWIRVTGSAVNDYCDVVAPYTVTTLTPEWVTQTQIGLAWSATGLSPFFGPSAMTGSPA